MSTHEQSTGTPGPGSGGRREAAFGGGTGRLWAWVVPAGLLAGLLAWAAGEPMLGTFTLTPEEQANGISVFGGSDMSLYLAGRRRVATHDSALHYGILGAALGAALGLAGGLSRWSARGAGIGMGVGLIAGAGMAALASLGLVPVFLANYRPDRPDLILPFAVHGGIWTAIGIAAGLAMGLGRRAVGGRLLGIVLGGAVGAMLGTVAYEVIVAVAFPLVRIETPVPRDPTLRVLAQMTVSLAVAIGAAWGAGGRRHEGAGPPSV